MSNRRDVRTIRELAMAVYKDIRRMRTRDSLHTYGNFDGRDVDKIEHLLWQFTAVPDGVLELAPTPLVLSEHLHAYKLRDGVTFDHLVNMCVVALA